jgi:nucleotidyltransferase substrate binding protein (TIGR01987 family)
MMKKFVEIDHERIKSSTRRGLFRETGELGLIDDFNKWLKFNDARNLTSHTYDENTAKEVYTTAKEFDKYVKMFISNLNEKIKDL